LGSALREGSLDRQSGMTTGESSGSMVLHSTARMSSGPDAGPPGPTQIRSQLPVRHHHELIADGLCLSHMGWIELSAPARSGITGRSGEEGGYPRG
jgi:hypothetical protein